MKSIIHITKFEPAKSSAQTNTKDRNMNYEKHNSHH